MSPKKLMRVTTVPISLKTLLKGQLKFMSSFFEVIGVSSDGEELKLVKESEGVSVFPVNMTRKITPITDLISLVNLYLLIKREKPLIVHTHTPKAGIIGMLASRLAGVPIRLHTVAGLPLMETKGLKRIILDAVERITYNNATMVYPNSKGLMDFIILNKYSDPSKLKVLGNGSSNGIDTKFFNKVEINNHSIEELKRVYNIGKDDFVFIFVGRIVSDKGINELVEGFKVLLQKRDNPNYIKLLLVGDREDDLDPLKTNTLLEIKNNSQIISVGFQKDVRPFFAISSALVFPSYREGFPNVVMQAGAMGIPSVVSNINGCNEIISSEENGLIIPVKDSLAIIDAMERLIEEKGLYEKLKKNSRSSIVERFDQQELWQRILEEYNYLINNIEKENY